MPQYPQQLTFEDWMQAVDDYVWSIAGCSVHDLADMPYRDWYDNATTPREAAFDALDQEGFPLDLIKLD